MAIARPVSRFEIISQLIQEEIEERFNEQYLMECELDFSDNFAELLEKLFILHIRVWRLEDLAGQSKDDEELANLKRKIDFCFKKKRPELIRCINSMMDDFVLNKRKFLEESVKSYDGFET